MKSSHENAFWSRVQKAPGCWDWVGCRNVGGYGRLSFHRPGQSRQAHRFSWELHYGPVPAGQNVCHRCDNPACVRPDHLFLGSQSENMQDCSRKGRLRFQNGEKNSGAKLSNGAAAGIRCLRKTAQYTQQGLADMFDVSRPLISLILNYKRAA